LLLDGLTRLEYRGYDSAGVCFVAGDGAEARLERVRAAGSVHELARSLNGTGADARCGIGHTRWATHGRVCVDNAHPFLSCDGSVALALNGIVENFAALRRELSGNGHHFESETDAEVVCHLVAQHYRGDLVEAVSCAAAELDGHFAFVCCHRDHDRLLVGFRRQCPLVVGRGDGETFLASSTTAFPAEIRRLQLPSDGDVVSATPQQVRFYAEGRRRARREQRLSAECRRAERGVFESLMLKEIHDQPSALRLTIAGFASSAEERHDWVRELAGIERLQFVACGTAYHAALAGKQLFEHWARIPCQVDVASEWRYRDPLADERTLVCAISQSGETADTLAAVRHARAHGLRTLAVTNMPESQITREADRVLHTRCGIELSVAATKTFTAQVALLACLAAEFAARRRFAGEQLAAATAALRRLPNRIEDFLVADHPIDEIAESYADAAYVFFLGRQIGLPVAFEGALKLREIAYIPCEAYPAAEIAGDRPRRRRGPPAPRRGRHLRPWHRAAPATTSRRRAAAAARAPNRAAAQLRPRPSSEPRQDRDRGVTPDNRPTKKEPACHTAITASDVRIQSVQAAPRCARRCASRSLGLPSRSSSSFRSRLPSVH
jgi:glucosamine--fructose-6-phosphate aminotransferase (isomerizing)